MQRQLDRLALDSTLLAFGSRLTSGPRIVAIVFVVAEILTLVR